MISANLSLPFLTLGEKNPTVLRTTIIKVTHDAHTKIRLIALPLFAGMSGPSQFQDEEIKQSEDNPGHCCSKYSFLPFKKNNFDVAYLISVSSILQSNPVYSMIHVSCPFKEKYYLTILTLIAWVTKSTEQPTPGQQ